MNEMVFMIIDFPLSLSKRRGDGDGLCLYLNDVEKEAEKSL